MHRGALILRQFDNTIAAILQLHGMEPERNRKTTRTLRPNLMTALATIFVLPLALGVGSGAQFLQPWLLR